MFDFFSVPRICFGPGKIAVLGDLLQPLGPRVLVVYNGGDSALAKVRDRTAAAGVATTVHRQKGEPTVADIDAGLNVARVDGCTGVIGVGGGSAIDAAKAIAGLLTNGGTALDYMEVIGAGKKITQPAAPWIAIPTTAGTGAEVTRNAVVGEPSKQFKASIRSELLLPRVALVDPELGVGVPADVTAASGMDALCQCIEAYLSTGASPLTDALALKGVELAWSALPLAVADGTDIAARSDMALAALISGVCLTNAGLGAVHGFAAPTGANYPVPHGVVCAALLPHVLKANASVAAAKGNSVTRLKCIVLGGIIALQTDRPAEELHLAAADAVLDLNQKLRIPQLSTYGIKEGAVESMVSLARKASSMKFNPVLLSDQTLQDILRSAL